MRGWTRKMRARKFFGIDGDPNLVLHHIDVEMRHKNPDRYV